MFDWLFGQNKKNPIVTNVGVKVGEISAPQSSKRRGLLQEYINTFPKKSNHCVYMHKKSNGEVFYVGIDWNDFRYSEKQPYYWNEYVSNELNGNYQVEVIAKDVTSDDAGLIKDRVLELYSEEVINTVNFNRRFNMEIFEVYSAAQKQYEHFRAEGLSIEKSGNIGLAIDAYFNAYEFYIKTMNSRNFDANEQYLKAHSPPPPSQIVDRLSMCLLKQGRYVELIDFGERYSCYFTRKDRTGGELKFFKRVLTAKEKLENQKN